MDEKTIMPKTLLVKVSFDTRFFRYLFRFSFRPGEEHFETIILPNLKLNYIIFAQIIFVNTVPRAFRFWYQMGIGQMTMNQEKRTENGFYVFRLLA